MVLWFGVTLSACESGSSTKNTDSSHRYGIASGEISYRLDGLQQGYETVYFDQWGAREARYTKATQKIGSGMDRKIDRLMITDKEWIYTIDFIEKTGTKTRNPAYDKEQIATNLDVRDLSRINIQKLYKLGGKKVGQDQIVDLPCEIWEVKRLAAKFWVWNQIVLKRTPKIATERTIIREAVKVTTGQAIPKEKFALPQDIKIQDLTKEGLRN